MFLIFRDRAVYYLLSIIYDTYAILVCHLVISSHSLQLTKTYRNGAMRSTMTLNVNRSSAISPIRQAL